VPGASFMWLHPCRWEESGEWRVARGEKRKEKGTGLKTGHYENWKLRSVSGAK